MKKRLMMLLAMMLVLGNIPAGAKDKAEVEQLTAEVETVVNSLPPNVETYAKDEKNALIEQIKKVKALLSKWKFDDAYVEISLCKHYINLLNAKKELYNAEKEYNEITKESEAAAKR